MQAEPSYYEGQLAGLGERFLHEIEAALQVGRSFPHIGSPYKHGTRRVYPKKFPFSVVYRIHREAVVVVAVAPFTRKPGYWRLRTGIV